MMRSVGIVPARAGSKRLPRKNVRMLGGKPLVEWALAAACAARRLDRIVLSSDDPEVLAIAAAYPGVLIVERPPELATDTSPAIDYVMHALRVLEQRGEQFDAVVIVQPTSPFTLGTDIDQTVELLERSGADTAVTVMPVDHATHPVKLKRMSGDRLVPYLDQEQGRMAAHELPAVFVRNCAVYATRRGVIDAGSIIGDDCRGHVMPREQSLDINEEIDFRFAEFLLHERGEGTSA